MVLLGKSLLQLQHKMIPHQVELFNSFAFPPCSRGLCWGIMLFLHPEGTMFYQIHSSSQFITFFLLLTFFLFSDSEFILVLCFS